jgi:hypothetical protein
VFKRFKKSCLPVSAGWSLAVAMFACFSFGSFAKAQEPKIVPLDELETLTIQAASGKLMLNNFNFLIEKAVFGGTKASVQCSVRNRSKSDANYSVYIAALDKAGGVVACFCLEPTLNTHEAGKIESLETSGLIDPKDKERVVSFFIKVIFQKKED